MIGSFLISWDFFWDAFPNPMAFILAWVVPATLVSAIILLVIIIGLILKRGKASILMALLLLMSMPVYSGGWSGDWLDIAQMQQKLRYWGSDRTYVVEVRTPTGDSDDAVDVWTWTRAQGLVNVWLAADPDKVEE